eukprot:679818_1
MADLEFEKAKAYLQEISPNGKGSIYDHLSSVLLKLIQEKPDKPLEIFETLSASVKDSQLEPEGLRESQPLFEDQADRDQLVDYIEKVRLLFRKKPKEVSEDAEEEEEPEPEEEPELCHIPDIQNDAAMFQWAGINFGPEDTLKLYLAIRQLCKENDGFDSVRFFGCISGTQADYFIVEAKLKEYPEAPESDDPDDRTEAPGQGANEFVYFVTNKLVGPQWTQLADVKPEHIKISRNVRRFFTGSLDGPVSGHPRFPWSEAVYLRAVISRICCTTVLSPAGYFTLNEEEEDSTELLQAEEYEAPLGSGMCSPETWVHRARHLLMQGRVVKYAPPEKDEEEDEPEEEAPKSPEDEEEPLPMLRSIAEDTFSGGQCWSFRVAPQIDARCRWNCTKSNLAGSDFSCEEFWRPADVLQRVRWDWHEVSRFGLHAARAACAGTGIPGIPTERRR